MQNNAFYDDVIVPDSPSFYENYSPIIQTSHNSLHNVFSTYIMYTLNCPPDLSHHIDEQTAIQGHDQADNLKHCDLFDATKVSQEHELLVKRNHAWKNSTGT